MAVSLLPLFPELCFQGTLLSSESPVGPFELASVRYAIAPTSAVFRSKGHLVAASCYSVKAVDGDKIPGEMNDEKPIVAIDNYGSFAYNLCKYIGELGTRFEVYRNDEVTVDGLRRMKPRGILISPRPGEPKESGISLQTVRELGPAIPLFGVCMGLQCIGEAFGGDLPHLFVESPFTAARYHSLVIENDSFPDDILEITAWTGDGLIMATRHKKYKHIQGLQFHPESVITSEGKKNDSQFSQVDPEI